MSSETLLKKAFQRRGIAGKNSVRVMDCAEAEPEKWPRRYIMLV